jgi:hypothetical protein
LGNRCRRNYELRKAYKRSWWVFLRSSLHAL